MADKQVITRFYQKLSAITLSRFITVSTMLVIAMVLTRLLDEESYGSYRKLWLIYAVLGPAFLNTLASTLYYRGKADDRDAAILVTLLMGTGFGLLTALAGFLLADFWSTQLNAAGLENSFRAFAPYMGLAVMAGMAEPLFLTLERKKWLLSYTMGYNMIEFVLIIAPFALGLPLPQIVLIMSAGPAMRVFILIYVVLRFTNNIPEWSRLGVELGSSLKYARGILLLTLISVGIIQIDKWIISIWFVSDALFATYEIGAKKLPFITAITSSVSATLVSEYTSRLRKGEYMEAVAEARQISQRLTILLLPLLSVCFVFAEELLRLLFGGYEASAPIFRIYLCTLLTQLIFPQSILLGLGKSDLTARYGGYEFILNLAASLLLVVYIGFIGPAIATLLGHFFFTFLLLIYCRRNLGINILSFFPLFRRNQIPGVLALIAFPVLAIFLKLVFDPGIIGFIVVCSATGLFSVWFLKAIMK